MTDCRKNISGQPIQATRFPEPAIPCPDRLDATLIAMLQRKNICSKEFISIQYDHTVQGGHVLGPVQGKGRVQAMATLTKVVPGSKKGVGLSQGMFPSYSEIDPYRMAGAGIDTAIRGLIALGIPLDAIAILDNFCWCSSDDPERLGQLKHAAKGCYDVATAFGTPFISGKDSMFNDFSGFDADNNPVKVSVPPTLLISSIGVHADVSNRVSMDAKIEGDLVYVIGETDRRTRRVGVFRLSRRMSGIPFLASIFLPVKARYERLTRCHIRTNSLPPHYPVTHGGLGLRLQRSPLPAGSVWILRSQPDMRPDYFLFSESLGSFVVTIAPDNKRAFEQVMG